MAASSALLVPSSPLTIRNTAPPPDAPGPVDPDRFTLFGTSWLDLQSMVASALALPISKADFAEQYGSFPAADQAEVAGCIAAMKDLRDLSGDFGDPKALKQRIAHDGTYLMAPKPPAELYGHIVWLALQIENAASTFTLTFSLLKDLLDPAMGTPEERAANLRELLTGEGGLASTAAVMRELTGTLSSRLAKFDLKVTDAADGIMQYSGSSSKIKASADELLVQFEKDLKELRGAADDAIKAWRDYTIAAVTTSVGLTIITFGLAWPVGLGLGIGLGVAAAKQRELYNNLMKDVAAKEKEVTKKTRLVTDLEGLNSQMPAFTAGLADFRARLSEIEGVWTNIGGNLAYIASNYTDEQLANYSWVIQTTKILDAQRKWQAISTTAQQFTQHSLVSYETLPFGQLLPA